MKSFESTFSDHKRQKIIERTTRGRNEKVHQRGQLTFQGFDKYGFQRIGRKKEQRYIIADHLAQVVKLIYARLTRERMPITDIARWLTARQEPTPLQVQGRSKKNLLHARRGIWNDTKASPAY